jgi:hypothetical protein
MTRLNSPLLPACIAAIVIGLFLFGRLNQSGFDFSSYVEAGDYFCDPARVPQNLSVIRNSTGFDGQFYYRLSLKPFTSQATEFGITIDNPPYRQQRIFYPLLTWILSLGQAGFVPVMMVLINFIALCALGYIGGSYAQTLKQHALWGVFLPLCPSFLFTLSRDLVEIVEVTLLLGSLLLLRRGKPVVATLFLSLAVLTRETSLLVAGAALIVYAFQWWKSTDAVIIKWYYFAVPMAVFLLWQTLLFYQWGTFPLYSSGGTLGIPFAGAGGSLSNSATLDTSFERRNFVGLIFLIVFTCAVLYHLHSTAAAKLEIVSWFLYATLAVSLSRLVWVEDWSFFRAVSQFCALGTVIIIAGKAKDKAFIFGCTCLFWLYLSVELI